jgi:hypothetical protein
MAAHAYKEMEIPFDKVTGNLVPCPDKKVGYIWQKNQVFATTMALVGKESTLRGFRTLWRDTHTQVVYGMAMTELIHMMQHAKIDLGIVTGDFCVVLRGAAYSLRYLEDA